MTKQYGFVLITILTFSCRKDKAAGINYRHEMRKFVQEISAYSRIFEPNFIVIPQNGQQLVSSTGDENGQPVNEYINAINGIGREDLNYGYTNDDEATPADEKALMFPTTLFAKNNGLKVLVTDYCSTPANMSNSYALNASNGFISFAADHRGLDNIPSFPSTPFNENNDTITNLNQAKNFLYLIDPVNYTTKTDFINAVTATNYDVLIMDLFLEDVTFTKPELEQLKNKANGGKRLVICYMSIGECENYRYYWNTAWETQKPEWYSAPNPDWAGNFKVNYWHPGWKSIIYGNKQSYTKKIIDAGFDGVYLDIIDAFEYFEENQD